MITSPLLEAKYEAQRRLSKKADHNLRNYPEIYRQICTELEAKYGRKFQYAKNVFGTNSESPKK